jgi:2,4-dienoyl-CoA reductase (NADPH2)
LSVAEIQQIVDEYSEGIRRSREAGFDAVEVHVGVGSILNQFISPLTNKRTDPYGGSLENRMRIILEILDNSRKKTGQDYTFMCRMSADEFMDDGHTLEDSKIVARMLEAAGVNCLNVQAGWHESSIPLVQMCVPRGAFVYLAEAIKKVVNIPVIAAYRINDPILAEQILKEGKADLVGMCRALIADPDLPNKAKNGQYDDICRCIACCRCLAGSLVPNGTPVECSVNARAGREAEYSIEAANKRKNVLIIGGGPAGMEAARIAALRGHQVSLWEKNRGLGGQLLLASVPPDKGEINTLREYFIKQMDKMGVQVKLGVNVTTEAVVESHADVVIVATGAVPRVIDIPGVKGNNVVTALEVLAGRKEISERVIIVGGGMVGCETALFLAKQSRQVTILEMLDRVGYDLERVNRWVIMSKLRQTGVKMETRAKVVEITNKGVRAVRGEVVDFFQGDTVVLAVGMRPNNELARELRGKVAELHVIGDCSEPRRIAEAIKEGFCVAREI